MYYNYCRYSIKVRASAYQTYEGYDSLKNSPPPKKSEIIRYYFDYETIKYGNIIKMLAKS